jgi:CRP-like cAMP-binding protein
MNTEMRERIERLRNVSLFRRIADDEAAMVEVAGLFRTVTVPAGGNVIVEGEDGDEMYIIKSGTVSIRKRTTRGEPYTVVELGAGDNVFFGEIALLDPDKRSATVLCTTDCEFYVLARERFLAYGDTNPATALTVTRELSRILCNRLRKANADIITLFDALLEEVEQAGGMRNYE